MNIWMFLIEGLVLGLVLGLIPFMLLYMAIGETTFELMKLKKGKVLLYVLPYQKFIIGTIKGGMITFKINDVSYSILLPKKMYMGFKRYPFLILDITEGYVATLEEAKELKKLEEAMGKERLQTYIKAICRKKELEDKEELTEEEKKEYQQLLNYIKEIENFYKFHIKQIDNQIVITPIYKDEVKNYYYDVNPATAFQYSMNLALHIANKLRRMSSDVMPYLILIIGAAVAVAIIWKIL